MSQRSETTDPSADAYRSHGYFEPFHARRILKRFEEEGVRFQIADASGVERWDSKFPQYVLMRIVPARTLRRNRIEIFVYLADAEKAQKIIDET
jgi:hypothetical protein